MADTDRARWTRLVADFESADLSQREFAHERGVPVSNLRYWIYRLRKESRPLVAEAAERSDQGPERGAAASGLYSSPSLVKRCDRRPPDAAASRTKGRGRVSREAPRRTRTLHWRALKDLNLWPSDS